MCVCEYLCVNLSQYTWTNLLLGVCVCKFECIVVSMYIVSVSVQVCVCVIVNVDCVGAQQGADSAASAE